MHLNRRLLACFSLYMLTQLPCQVVAAAYPQTIEAHETKTVGSIEVTMENLPPGASFSAKTVTSRMKTHIGDPFSQTIFDSDLKMLAQEYDRIDPIIQQHGNQLNIQLKLWARPTIRSITWEGNTHYKTKTLQKELGISTFTAFNRQDFNKAFNKVKEFYIKHGYFESQLQYSTRLDRDNNEIEVLIKIDEGRSGRIDNIIFEGFSKKERSEILQMIYTKKYNLFTSWLTGHGTFNENALDEDQLTIVNYLHNRGYADAKVNIKIEESKKEGRIVLYLTADKGPIFHFGKITYVGNKLFPDETIESRFIARTGDVYSPDKLRQTSQYVKDLYGRLGYIDANVQYETFLDENEPIYNVAYSIDEGQEYKIGLIHIVGNIYTQNSVILRESLLVPGETFDSAKLKATQMRLENVGYFKNVNVYAVRAHEDHILGETYRDVYIEVEETTTGSVDLSFGYSTQDSLFGVLGVSERNFNWRGFENILKRGPAALRGGGEFAQFRVNVGEKQRSISLSWMDPYYRDTLWRLGFEVQKTFSDIVTETYDVSTVGGSIYASYPLTQFWTFGTKYRARYNNIDFKKCTTTGERRKVVKDMKGNISAIGLTMNYDSTDNAVKPHNGYRSLIEAEAAGILGDFTFLRFGYINTYYTQLWRKGIMKYRFDFKFIVPAGSTDTFGEIPISERFFLGGENSVRGYKPFSIGPKFNNMEPQGGISYNLFSVEYLQEVFGPLDLFFFVDAGSLTEKTFTLKDYRLSYGAGIRFDIGNRMPVTLGYGIPVNPAPTEEKRFFFSLGGQF